MSLTGFGLQIYKEFGILLAVGNTYPFTHTKGWKVFTAVNYLLGYFFIISTMPVLAYTSYLVRDNIAYLSQALHMLIVGAVAIAPSLSVTLQKKKTEEFEEFLRAPESFATYGDSEYFQTLIKESSQRTRNNIALWVVMYGICGVVGISQGFIDSLAGRASKVSNIDGAWLNLPFILWSPFDLENNRLIWTATYAGVGCFIMYSALQVASGVVAFTSFLDKILVHLKLMLWAIEKLDLRAEKMFNSRHPRRRMKDVQKEYDECYYQCIKENVMHHVRIKIEFERLLDVGSTAVAVPVYGGAMLMGMAMITMTSDDDPRLGPKCFAFVLAITEAMTLFNLCNLGQALHDISNQIFVQLCYTKWYMRSIKCSRAITIMRYGWVRPLKLEAALLTLNLGLFADLANSAYSIFSLNAAQKQGEEV